MFVTYASELDIGMCYIIYKLIYFDFAWSICNVNSFNGPKLQEMLNIHLLYNNTFVDEICSVVEL